MSNWSEKPCEKCGVIIRIHEDWENPPTICSRCKAAGTEKSVDIGASIGDSIIVTGGGNIAVHGGHVVGRDIVLHDTIRESKGAHIISEDQAFERIDAAVRLNLEQLGQNMRQARAESNQFFKLTLIFSCLGFVVVAVGVCLLLAGEVTAGIVSAVAGLIPEVTAALFFKKDRELRATIEAYHHHILESQRILTMIDVAETVKDGKERDRIKQEIIFKVLGIAERTPNTALERDAEKSAAPLS